MSNTEIARVRRSQRDYSMAFKLSVIESVEKGEQTYRQAQKKYGIQGRSTVLKWLRKHGNLDWSNRLTMNRSKTVETPEQKIKRLEKELEDERLKNLILNTMIDISDEKYGTDIRKKSSPKQSKNSSKKGK